ncbi:MULTISPECIES: methyltransferase domain-containing protein [unclassified Pseudomonas]|uniref:methyltransferase domain-containing protein n=1 Tax=unclassified Pseudomonas TaxID=196821 RepID=UPI0037F93F75
MDNTQLRHEASEIERRVGDGLFNNQQLTRSAAAYKKSLSLDKNNIKTLNNFGALCEQIGDTERSIELYRKACLQLNNETKNAHIYYRNLARACHSIKKINLGLWAYEKAIESEDSTSYEIAVNYLDLLSSVTVNTINKQTLLTLEKISTIEKIDFELLSHVYYKHLFTGSTIDSSEANWPSKLAAHLLEYKFSFQVLKTQIITNPILEDLLERSKEYSSELDKQTQSLLSEVIDAQHHLSQHTFNTYDHKSCQTTSSNRITLKLHIRKPRGQNQSLNRLVHETTGDPLRSFYESNPYPKWTYLPHHTPSTTYDYFSTTGLINTNKRSPKAKILIAGCGTGRHAIQMALNYPDAQIFGIDISLSSLQFANAMKQKHDIENVSFIHCSIFDISTLKIKFHIIECIGVLHHLKQPSRCIKALLMALHRDGIIKLGLYSKTARTSIETLKKKCSEHKIAYSPENLMAIRKLAQTQYPNEMKSIIWSRDFFSHQGCMDLLFNPYEDSYTPKRIYDLLRTYNLDFCGFETYHPHAPFFTKFNSGDDLRDLFHKWHIFESVNPTFFSDMYLFWIKPRNTHENRKL